MKPKLLLSLAMLLSILAGCEVFEPTTHTVVYRIKGSAGRAMVNIANVEGGTEQFNDVAVPWRRILPNVKTGHFLYLSAQNQADRGVITCEIEVDGKIWKTSTSVGAYVIATCSGNAGSE